MAGLQVVWFKRDLRVFDHRPLAGAAAAGDVLPLYIVEPELWRQPDASARQWNFARECLGALQDDLARLGRPLMVRMGEAVDVLRDLHERFGVAALWSHEETGNDWTYARDRAVAAWAKAEGIVWREERQFGVVRRLKSRNGWAARWDQDMAQPLTPPPRALRPLPDGVGADDWPTRLPSAKDLGLAADPCPSRQTGGRSAGLELLASFLTRRGRDYRFEMSSPVTAFDASSRLSPHLTWGTLSMREIAQATQARLAELEDGAGPDARRWRASLTSFSARQHWHCHFMQKLEDQPALEFANLHPAYDGLRPQEADAERLAAWSEGATGYPFIDACMRALNQHGWLNFRMRAMLMSFASYHLWLPWRETGLALARKFVDYEPGIHWPQVQMQSGVTGINAMRVYNPVKQGFDHDGDGRFVRLYVPELASAPDAFVHEPWRWDGASSLVYPPRIVDHVEAARAAREALYAVRKQQRHREEARAIVEKHGSRKSGVRQADGARRPPSTRRSKPAKHRGASQLSFDF